MHTDRLTTRSLSASSRSAVMLMLNLAGAVIYVLMASPSWAIPAERAAGIYTVTGEPLVWITGILPVIATFFVLNLTWGILALKRPQWRSMPSWLLAASGWLVAISVDFAHH